MSGLHMPADKSFGHLSSSVKVVDNASMITCANCHPVNDGDNAAPRAHINAADFQQKANMSNAHNDVALSGVGFIRGAQPSDATCTASCHYNGDDTFGNETTYYKPDLKRFYGSYQTSNWGSQDLRCNECHSLPSQEASFGGTSSINANKHHYNHMYKYKLTLNRFTGDYRDIYCYDCHRLPDTDSVRGFKNHSTTGQGGSGYISLPIKSSNAKVNINWRNGNIGYDGITPPSYNQNTKTCDNVYCHTALTSATWTDKGCAECHGVMDGVLTGSGAPGYRNWTTASTYPAYEDYPGGGGAHYTHVIERGMPCRVCHLSGGKDGNQANHNQGAGTVIRANVNVSMGTEWSFKGSPATYDSATRECSNVNCHYGVSKNWDCEPLH
jgi:predicted CxxxxCH...CXXCH cytochrome family protein